MGIVHCEICQHRITARRTHVVLGREHIVCVPCTGTQDAHRLSAPDCPKAWHDGWDHEHMLATRAAALHVVEATR